MIHEFAKTLKRTEEELKLAGYSPRTVSSYLGVASRFLRFADRPAEKIGRDDVSRYFVYLTERGQAPSYGRLQSHPRRIVRDLVTCRTAGLRRGKLLGAIDQAANRGEWIFPHRLDPADSPSTYLAWRDGLYRKAWVVYSKPPFGGAEGGLEYLGRYSHRVAISNSRLLGLEGDRVVFRYKDYRDGGRVKVTSLEAVEFLRRFLLHVLPLGFQRLRSYGLLANRHRTANLETCRRLLGCASPPAHDSDDSGEPGDGESWAEEVERLTGEDPRRCPVCGKGRLVLLEVVLSRDERHMQAARAPP